MRTKIAAALLLGLCAGVPALAQTQPSPPALFPFVIRWDDASAGTATDVSFLNAKPAGVNGYIVVKGGHFVESRTGKRIRFLGTNFAFRANFPEHADAEKIAAHLAKLGINIVRIHHHDFNWGALWDQADKTHTKFDPAGVDKLDYLIAQLKKNGIYVDLNLHVTRAFTPENGFPESINALQRDVDKRIDNLDRRMIDLQKQFAHDYLSRVNPYTGLSYIQDPAVAIIEINNENSLAGDAKTDITYFNALPEPFRGEVVRAWNQWLFVKYRATSELRKAWTSPNDKNDGSYDLASPGVKWSLEDRTKDVRLTLVSPGSRLTMPDIQITNPTTDPISWHKQLHMAGLNLVDGQIYTLTLRAKADSAKDIWIYAASANPDFHQVGLSATLKVGPDWAKHSITFETANTGGGPCRITFTLGNNAGTLSLADVGLSAATGSDALANGQSLETRSIDLPVSKAQQADWRRFLVDTETSYASEMRSYLRGDLKVHANIVDTQVAYGELAGFKREEGSDFIDNHGYWGHPRFSGGNGKVNWEITNKPLSDSLAAPEPACFPSISAYRVAGKPFTLSEYNHPAPNDYQAEMFPELASYAALQDWDAIFEFDYGDYGSSNRNGPFDRIQGHFGMQCNPAKESFVPAAALIFRAAELAPASSTATLHLPASAPYSQGNAQDEWRAANGGSMPDPFTQRLQATIDPAVTVSKIVRASAPPASSSVRAVKTASGTLYLAQGAASIAAAGFVGGQTIDLGAAEFAFARFGNQFAALSLTSLDEKPIRESGRLLLTVTGKAENLDMKWNKDRTSVGADWGHGPVEAEGIPATVTVANTRVKRVWALDPCGARAKEVPVSVSGGNATFSIAPEYRTVWYEIGQ